MKYAVIVKSGSPDAVAAACKAAGASNIRVARRLKQVFCETSSPDSLAAIPGVIVKPVSQVKADVSVPRRRMPQRVPIAGGTPHEVMEQQLPTYAASQASIASQMYDLRSVLDPPIIGSGSTIAILDTGIRKSHRGLVGKVVHEVDVTGSGSTDDVFSHGTAVAYMAVGGRHKVGEESGIAPGAMVMNIKVLNDRGMGDDETITLGLEAVADLIEAAKSQGLPVYHPMYPNLVNMSFGKTDPGDPDDPMRLAVQEFVAEVGTGVPLYAAAGNNGPEAGTITMPASMAEVSAVGATTFSPFDVWSYSSRGPTPDGLVKPNFVFFGVDIVLASSASDDAFEVKSGTSFSTPAAAGFWALALEGMPRVLPEALVEQFITLPPEEWQRTFGPLFAAMLVKPAGYTLGQRDNALGLGMPFGSLVIAGLESVAGGDLSVTVAQLVPAMMLVSIMPMIARMAK